MDEIKIDAATLEEAGAAIGFMFAAFLRGFKEGVDAYDVMEAANDIKEVHETEEPLKARSGKNRNRGLQEVLVRSMRAAGGMRENPRRIRAGRDTPFPVHRLRGRNALQALRGNKMRRFLAGRRA